MTAEQRCIETDVETTNLQALCDRGEGPWSADALAEDARVLAAFQRTREGVPFEDIKAWMESWGAPNELPPPKSRTFS